MAWETRGNRSYLYRKERIGKTVKSVYIGHGETAILLDKLIDYRQEEKKIESEQQKRPRAVAEMIDREIEAFSEANQTLVEALFLAGGFHQHKRQWSRKRK